MKTVLRLLALLCAAAGLLAFYMAIMCILKTGEYCDPALFSDIAVSSVYAFSNLHPEHFLYVSFVAPSDEILGKMTGEE